MNCPSPLPRFAPSSRTGSSGVLGRYLARNGYEAQQTEAPVAGDRADNLLDALQGDGDVHGTFDGEARRNSIQFVANRRRVGLTALTTALAAVVYRGLRE